MASFCRLACRGGIVLIGGLRAGHPRQARQSPCRATGWLRDADLGPTGEGSGRHAADRRLRGQDLPRRLEGTDDQHLRSDLHLVSLPDSRDGRDGQRGGPEPVETHGQGQCGGHLGSGGRARGRHACRPGRVAHPARHQGSTVSQLLYRHRPEGARVWRV